MWSRRWRRTSDLPVATRASSPAIPLTCAPPAPPAPPRAAARPAIGNVSSCAPKQDDYPPAALRAEATGIDYRRARLHVFLISSAGLGVIGAFYAQFYNSISPQVFSLMLLGLLVLTMGLLT